MMIDDRSVQRFLQAKGFYAGQIDGAFGGVSKAAARQFLAKMNPADTTFTPDWPDARVRVGVEQAMFESIGQDLGRIDGLNGPRTQIALERWQDHITFAAPSPGHIDAPQWPLQKDIERYYGKPGQNQAMLVTPYPLYLDWDLKTQIGRFSIHEKCHDAALRVMQRVLAHYGPVEIHRLGLDQFGGCLNVRLMRNGSQMSTHSWGIAIDWDADRNPLRATSKTALMATPSYSKFLDLWEEEGFVSLGRARNYDWMHVQAARL